MPEELLQRLEASGRLPTPPAVVVRLLELTRRSDVAVRDLAETIALDPGLTVKVLRFVNSPIAGLSREVTSLQQAVALIGVRGVKMMALSFAVLPSQSGATCRGFDPDQFLVQSLACAVAARVVARLVGAGSTHEAFAAGLLSQIGRMVLASAVADDYAEILAQARNAPRDLPPLERGLWGQTYATIGGHLLRRWGLPETLCTAITAFRDPQQGEDANGLARVLNLAELAACVVCPDKPADPIDARDFADAIQQAHGVSGEQAGAALAEIAAEVGHLKQVLDVSAGRVRSIEEIESQVRERIAELSVAMHLENRSMAEQQADLLRRATTDPLTGIGNRAAFDARLALEIDRAVRTGTPLALMMLDVDRFKSFNDTYGHQAGDRILQAVAHLLDENVRKIDYAARYGGEEFAVIAPDTHRDGLLVLAERLRECVAHLAVPWEGHTLRVTVSIGAAVFSEILDAGELPGIIRAADAQLYNAKTAGRNRVCFTVERRPAPVVQSA
ncbi:MAG: GGDEF domain-containing protein [Planctomycetes bacterium]|nr:GGDEF domain-containing protein [Planctomycetota bacterium]